MKVGYPLQKDGTEALTRAETYHDRESLPIEQHLQGVQNFLLRILKPQIYCNNTT
jgi:hypothetical protein